MHNNVFSFFVTKIAKDEDGIIDPGEAVAASLAAASGPVAKASVPLVNSLIKILGPKRVKWTGTPLYGMTGIGDSHDMEALKKGMNFTQQELQQIAKMPAEQRIPYAISQYKTPTKKLLGLFNIGLKVPVGFTADPHQLEALGKGYESINSMIEKNKLIEKGVRMELTPGPVSKFLGPSYNTATKTVRLPWVNEEFALHELGHASHMTQPGAMAANSFRKLLKRTAIMSIPMAYLAGNEIQKMLPGTIDDKIINFVQSNAPSIMAATWAGAEVYPEVQATTRAVNHIYKTKGKAAAIKTLKALLPALSSYLIPIIPAMVGISMAKKYFFDAKKDELKKEGGIADQLWAHVSPLGEQLSHIGGQVAAQTSELMSKPVGEVASTLWKATNHVVKSPSFATGAVMSAIPVTAFTYIHHNTPHGKILREKRTEYRRKHGILSQPEVDLEKIYNASKDDSVTFPAIAGITAAMSGGILTKMFSDLLGVL